MKHFRVFILNILMFAPLVADGSQDNQKLNNLEALIKSTGNIRYFYPGDEASQIDWDMFLVYGSKRVQEAKNEKELTLILNELFNPIAPAAEFLFKGDKPRNKLDGYQHEDLTPIYWQHLGLGGNSPLYKSKRYGRPLKVVNGNNKFGYLMQSVDISKYEKKEFKLSAWVKTEEKNQAQFWARVDGENREILFFNNMDENPVSSKDWVKVEQRGLLEKGSNRLIFGLMVKGANQAWIDNVSLTINVKNEVWVNVPLANPSIENWKDGRPVDWTYSPQNYVIKQDNSNNHQGKSSVFFSPPYETMQATSLLFPTKPDIDDHQSLSINDSLVLHMPSIVFSDDNGTVPSSNENLDDLIKKISTFSRGKSKKDLQIADIATFWNAIQHFYPYFEFIDGDWNVALTDALSSVLGGLTDEEFDELLKVMVAQINDGHARVYGGKYDKKYTLPLLFDVIEDKVVIVASSDSNFQVGDIVEEMDGQDIKEKLNIMLDFISGSPQWKTVSALRKLRFSTNIKSVKLKINRNKTRKIIETSYGEYGSLKDDLYKPIQLVAKDIFYVDLDRASMGEIDAQLKNIAKAKGVIFDLRGYPKGNHKVISHLLTKEDNSKGWMKVAHTIYPNQKNVNWKEFEWSLKPLSPHISGNVVFLTNSSAISYAESFMSFIKHYDLATIIGQPTAGTNGNVNTIELPSGCKVVFTGMRVLKHDGSQLHLIGIKPDLQIDRTIDSLKAGRDEYVEAGLKHINSN